MSFEVGELACTATIEQLAPSGITLKKVCYKNSMLYLGRNEFNDIILKVVTGKKDLNFLLRDIIVHKKFAKEGKATIKMVEKNIQFLLCNCPPDKLIMFLKTMVTKLECLKQKGFMSERKKLLSGAQRSFEQISPLQMKELQSLHSLRTKQAEQSSNKVKGLSMLTPKGKIGVGKRKRTDNDTNKENIPPKGIKFGRMERSSQPVLNPVTLSAEQVKVLNAVLQGSNIFFTGSAGTGKSFLLRRIIGALPPQHTFATASTGVAACHIGGTTLHAFAGIGSGKAELEQCLELASRPIFLSQWRKCKHLIVDEISMVDGDFFDKLEAVARITRKCDEPFGGIQLILCGDFLQLPPVTRGKEIRKFAFQSRSWYRCIQNNFELIKVRRQSDKEFISILQDIRIGRCSDTVIKTLSKTSKHCIEKEGILPTRLCTHKEDVDHINNLQLNKLKGETRSFEAFDSNAGMQKLIDSMCPVSQNLQLRVGTQVMLTKNLDVSKGLVNGARGIVVGFEKDVQGLPIVKFLCGQSAPVRHGRFTMKLPGGVVATRRQLPLKLAWAISIHKSQGMSLDCVEISLSRVFESGQAYVALSRAKSLAGLRVLDFESSCVRASSDVLKFYHSLKMASSWEQNKMDKYLSNKTYLGQD